MTRRYFGTDGIRGRVGEHPLTVDFALQLASAAALVLAPKGGTVLVGKDTRLSGYMFEAALEAGFTAAGVNVMLIGPLPTPAIAYLTTKFECDFGVVISASHNPYEDNGIKFFDSSGGKLSDEIELKIEQHLDATPRTRASGDLGRATRVDKLRVRYQEFCASTVPQLNLTGFKIVIDCANGAGYKVGPRILTDLGAEIVPIGCSPNGRNINLNCGSTSPELLQLTVPGVRAHAGIALDGDGDRLVMVDHLGRVVDGDQLLYVIARARHEDKTLVGPVVGTVMSNLGLEHALAKEGIAFRRARVGDRYVHELLKETGGVLGGETSGHLLCLDRTTTGDALISALQVLAIMKKTGRSLAELAAPVVRYPQVLENVRLARKLDPSASVAIQEAVAQAERRLGANGRIVLRPSGTEPVIRVMVEGKDERLVRELAKSLAASVALAAEAAA
jgi:phosphoglucosamine mutase